MTSAHLRPQLAVLAVLAARVPVPVILLGRTPPPEQKAVELPSRWKSQVQLQNLTKMPERMEKNQGHLDVEQCSPPGESLIFAATPESV